MSGVDYSAVELRPPPTYKGKAHIRSVRVALDALGVDARLWHERFGALRATMAVVDTRYLRFGRVTLVTWVHPASGPTVDVEAVHARLVAAGWSIDSVADGWYVVGPGYGEYIASAETMVEESAARRANRDVGVRLANKILAEIGVDGWVEHCGEIVVHDPLGAIRAAINGEISVADLDRLEAAMEGISEA